MDKLPVVRKRATKPKDEEEFGIESALYCIRLNVCTILGMKASEFAKLMHCTRQTVCRWEREFSNLSENTRSKALSALSHVYNIPTDEFESGTGLICYYGQHKKEILDHVSKLRG